MTNLSNEERESNRKSSLNSTSSNEEEEQETAVEEETKDENTEQERGEPEPARQPKVSRCDGANQDADDSNNPMKIQTRTQSSSSAGSCNGGTGADGAAKESMLGTFVPHENTDTRDAAAGITQETLPQGTKKDQVAQVPYLDLESGMDVASLPTTMTPSPNSDAKTASTSASPSRTTMQDDDSCLRLPETFTPHLIDDEKSAPQQPFAAASMARNSQASEKASNQPIARRTVRMEPSLLSPSSFDNSRSRNGNHQVTRPPLPVLQRQAQIDSRPGAFATRGRGVGQVPAWSNNMHHHEEHIVQQHRHPQERNYPNESPLSRRQTRSGGLSAILRHSSGISNDVENAEIAQANAVDNAEAVVYATSVRPDRTAKQRRIVIGLGILALVVIAILVIGLVDASVALAEERDKHYSTPEWCKQPLGDQDVFAQCLCSNNNTTNGLQWSATEQSYYDRLRELLENNTVVEKGHVMESCEPENQCMVWMANYKRRNVTEEEFEKLLYATAPAIQYYSLCMTYLNFDGYNWTNNQGWMEQNTSYCDWFGIRCSFLSRVKSVLLPSNGLNGTLPSQLGNMEFMKHLDLSGNDKIVGTLPLEFAQLTALHILDLGGTAMNGTIPNAIQNLTRLDHLALSGCSFSGSIPAIVSKLDRMQCLHLDHNQFSGEIPSEFGLLKDMQVFFVNDNELSGPVSNELFQDWEHLEQVNLSYNSFTGPFPDILFDKRQFRDLETTFVVGTQFDGPISVEDSFCNGRNRKREGSIVVLNCSETPVANCKDAIFCFDDENEDIPSSLVDAV